jgi:CubicO group peptidase (beta-lactamase class C family)
MKLILRFLQVAIGLAFLAALGVYAVPRTSVDVSAEAAALRSMVFDALPTTPETAATPAAFDASATPPPAKAEASVTQSTTASEIERTWRAWMTAQGLETGAMAFISADGTEYGTGIGRTADERRPVMSMSKAITGLCLDQVLSETALPWTAALGDFPDRMSAAGLTPRPGNAHLTLAEMATHTAGLAPDLTQAAFVARTHGALGLHRRFTWQALSGEGLQGEPGEFFYSNVNYAALGVAIEALTGESYAQACMDRIVAPLGLQDVVTDHLGDSLYQRDQAPGQPRRQPACPPISMPATCARAATRCCFSAPPTSTAPRPNWPPPRPASRWRSTAPRCGRCRPTSPTASA